MKKLIIILMLMFILTLSSCDPEEETEFQITFKGNGGTPITQIAYVTYGEPIDISHIYVPSRYGYDFIGFYETQYPTATMSHWGMTTGDIYNKKEDTILWAQWI